MKQEFEIRLDSEELVRHLGIEPDTDTLLLIHSLRDAFLASARGCVWYAEMGDAEGQALFDGLPGGGRGYLLVAASVDYAHGDDDDPLADWVLDALGNAAVQFVQTEFLRQYCREHAVGVRIAAQPGSDAPHEWVRRVLELTKAEIRLTDSMLMLPQKSVALVYARTGGDCVLHDCTACTALHCPYRSDPRARLTIRRRGGEDLVDVPRGSRLLDVLRQYDDGFAFPCGGRGVCGKCAVRFLSDAPVSDADRRHIPPDRLEAGMRLACAHTVEQNAEIELLGGAAAQILSTERGAFAASDSLEGGRFMGIPTGGAHYLAAVDIGTTTVCTALVDMRDSRLLSVESFLNPQAAYGADLVSRIQYCDDSPNGLATLHASITDSVNAAVRGLCARARLSERDIAVTAVAGNTVMQHILTGDPVASMGHYPFAPVYTCERVQPAAELGLVGAAAYVMPSISGYVGGDIVAGLVTLPPARGYSLFLDLGTNGEIVLFDESEILAASTAVGPAFEGVNIECGMAAVDGAVTDVRLSGQGYQYDCLGDAPRGLCGSGLLSFAALLLEQKLVEPSGYMPCGRAYLTGDIYLSQKDIRQLQLAKSAVRAGILTLMAKRGVASEDIEAVYLAGGFGNYAKPSALCAVGILDPVLTKKARQIGNASLEGCIQTALSTAVRKRAAEIAAAARHIDLSADKQFSDLFIEEMHFNG